MTVYNDFEIESDFTLRVQAWSQPDEGTALRRFLLVRDLLIANEGISNVSVWRVQVPSTGTWVIVICGRPEHVVEVEGEPHEFTDGEAAAFVARRLGVGAAGAELGLGDVVQVASYGPDGAYITPDGRTVPVDPKEDLT